MSKVGRSDEFGNLLLLPKSEVLSFEEANRAVAEAELGTQEWANAVQNLRVNFDQFVVEN